MKTLSQWRSDGELLSLAARVLDQPEMQHMLSVLETESPAHNIKQIADGAGAMFEIGLIYGYRTALEKLKSMREPLPKPPQEIKPTWGVPDEE